MKLEYKESFADWYVHNRARFTPTNAALFSTLQKVGVRGRVLDYGGGDGCYAERLIQEGADQVIVLDASFPMLQAGKKRQEKEVSNIFFEAARGERIPHPSETFDLVFSNFCLHYIAHSAQAIREVCRVLKKNGAFVGTVSDVWLPMGSESLEDSTLPLTFAGGPPVPTLVKTGQRIREEMRAAGLRVVSWELPPNPTAAMAEGYPERDKIRIRSGLFVARKV